jgi:HlyD family secretion protein
MTRQRIIGLAALAALLVAALATRGFGLFDQRSDALKLYGNVDIREVELGFRVAGRIEAIAVDEGARVRAGDMLARLDTATLKSKIAQADAQVAQREAELEQLVTGNRRQDVAQAAARAASAEVTLREAEQDYARREPLAGTGAISNDLWQQTVATRDRARAQLDEARQALSLQRSGARAEAIAAGRAALQAAKADRASAATDLGDAELRASVDGTVVTRAREPGAVVQAGETVFTLSIDRPLRVRAYVAEGDLSRISPGMKVIVTADGNPRRYQGTIGYIAPNAEFTPKTVQTEDLRTDLVYRLRIIVTNPDDALRQGQPVSVLVPGARPARED